MLTHDFFLFKIILLLNNKYFLWNIWHSNYFPIISFTCFCKARINLLTCNLLQDLKMNIFLDFKLDFTSSKTTNFWNPSKKCSVFIFLLCDSKKSLGIFFWQFCFKILLLLFWVCLGYELVLIICYKKYFKCLLLAKYIYIYISYTYHGVFL